MEHAAVFAPTFIRGVFPQNRGDEIPESEQLRIGLRARIEPGKTAPLKGLAPSARRLSAGA
jgi:hypothetical protein